MKLSQSQYSVSVLGEFIIKKYKLYPKTSFNSLNFYVEMVLDIVSEF
jgi:hypothetical protein